VQTGDSGAFSFRLPPGVWKLSAPNGDRTAVTTVDLTGINRAMASTELTLLDVPGEPRDVTAVAGDANVLITWLAPSDDGGAPVTGYTVTSHPGERTCHTDGSACTIEGLSNDTAYAFTVRAKNAVGVGAASLSPGRVTALAPQARAPHDVTAVAGNREATIIWKPPHAGAGPVIGYTVAALPGGNSCASKDLTCTITGLTNGTAYTFSVTVHYGVSSPSVVAFSDRSYTPAGSPSQVRNVSAAAAGKRSAVISWKAPLDDGGLPITGYTVTAFPGGRTCTVTAGASRCRISGLTSGQAYTFAVVARNASGLASEISPGSVPITPTGKSAVRIGYWNEGQLRQSTSVRANGTHTSRIKVPARTRLLHMKTSRPNTSVRVTAGRQHLAVTRKGRLVIAATPGLSGKDRWVLIAVQADRVRSVVAYG
jgi:hypothetical protein